jgi:DNA-binding NarL/FixJ family response regulator
MHDDAEPVRELFEVGETTYLVKTISREQLIAAARSIARGGDVRLVGRRGP